MHRPPESNRDRNELQKARLLAELHRRFPADAGYDISESTWVDIVDGRPELTPVVTVAGNGMELTFFPRTPESPPGRPEVDHGRRPEGPRPG